VNADGEVVAAYVGGIASCSTECGQDARPEEGSTNQARRVGGGWRYSCLSLLLPMHFIA
jgi:hypothetical protein